MRYKEIDAAFKEMGCRLIEGESGDSGAYYRYYKEGFCIVLVLDADRGEGLSPDAIGKMRDQIQSAFYRPQWFLSDFPDGFPVYHVEVLALLVGENAQKIRSLCAECSDAWGYLPREGQLLVYENQPGDFFGLRASLEKLGSAKGIAKGDAHRGAAGAGGAANGPGAGGSAYGAAGFGGAAKNAAGALRDFFSNSRLPYATVGLIAANVAIYLILQLLGKRDEFIINFGGVQPFCIVYKHQWWRLLTAGFLHFGPEHLVNNMVILFLMGERLEHVIGHARFLCVYFASLLGGSLLSCGMMTARDDYLSVSAGASGAIFGVIGAFLWVLLLSRGRVEGISAPGLVFMIALSMYFGLTAGDVDNWGHVGGLIAGFIVCAVLWHKRGQRAQGA